MERGENRARFIAIRLKINIFPRPFARVPSFKIPPFTGASNKQRTGKYFDEYIYHGRTIRAKYHFVSLADLR